METILNTISYIIKPVFIFLKKIYFKVVNRNKFFVDDYKNIVEEKEFYFSKKINKDEYGVFNNKNKDVIRIYKKPEHNNPKKLAKQYAKKLAVKKAKKLIYFF